MKKLTFFKLLSILLPVLAYILVEPLKITVKQAFFIMNNLDVELLKGYVNSFTVFAPIASFLLMVFQSAVIPLSAFIIISANVAIWGWVKGAILSWFGCMAGAMFCFLISKFYIRCTVTSLSSKLPTYRIDKFFEKYGKHTILIARLFPYMPFDLISYASGLTSIDALTFLWATGIGYLPTIIIYSYFGEMLTGSTKLIINGLLVVISAGFFIYMLFKIRHESKQNERR